ncbi:reverse transcriptase domain-containing protein [Tanacetum coccineum]
MHAMMKFLTPRGIATLCAQFESVYECRWSEKKEAQQEEAKEEKEWKSSNVEGEENILVNPAFSEQTLSVMVGVPRWLIKHALNVNNYVPPVAQKRRVLAERSLPFFETLKNITKKTKKTIDGLKRRSTGGCAKQASFGRLQPSDERDIVEVLNAKSVDVQEVNTTMEEEGDNWMTPIIKCLEEGNWPMDENEARALRTKISPFQAKYIIREVHEGACEMHASARSVVAKIMRQGYYWPTMHEDTKEGLDILGPLPEGPDKLKFIIVAIDYFTKWIKANPWLKSQAHRTMLKTSNGERPFSLTYESEAVIPAEIGMPTYQTIHFNEAQNEEEMRLNLDLSQERRETVAIREANYKKEGGAVL